MNKYCTNCGNKLPENVGMCVKCGKMIEEVKTKNTNNKKKFPVWAIILIVLGILFTLFVGLIVLFGIILTSDEFDEDFDYFPNITEERGTIGDTLHRDNYQITLVDAKKYDTLMNNEIRVDAEDGKEFLVLFLNISYINSYSNYIEAANFDGRFDNHYVHQSEKYAEVIDGYEYVGYDQIELMPGINKKVYVVYEIDNNWEEFELRFGEQNIIADLEKYENVYFNIHNIKENRGL